MPAAALPKMVGAEIPRLPPTAETGPISVPLNGTRGEAMGGAMLKGVTPEYLDSLTAWIANHDRLARRSSNGTPIIRVDCVNVDPGERWFEYSTVWSLCGARDVLGH